MTPARSGADAAAEAAATRRCAGLFALSARGLVEVSGGDRLRWLDGMLTADLTRLAPGPERSGCRALALTRKGRVVAVLHVWLRPASLWLETDTAAIPDLVSHLGVLVVADDVRLADPVPAQALLALEGPASRAVLEAAVGRGIALAAGSVADLELASAPVVAAAWGESGEEAFRIAAPADRAPRVADALAEAGARFGLVRGSAEAFEILRIEAGAPRFGAEVGGELLPAEAGLEAAIAFDKGCYTGQEIVARVASRGRVHRRLVGLALEAGAEAPERGAPIEAGEERVGEVTSACVSPLRGAIALGFVRIPFAEPGSRLRVGGRPARAVALPFAGAERAGRGA